MANASMHDVAKTVSTENNVRRPRGAMGVAVGGLVALVILLAGIKAMQIAKMGASPMTMPPTTVSSAVVKEEDWAPTLSAVGSISAVQGAIVSTELGGIVSEVGFQSGSEAKKGEVLLKLDASSEE